MSINYCPSRYTPFDDVFEGCPRCQADEEMLEESVHPDTQELFDTLSELVIQGEPSETLWCRNCKGYVNSDYVLVQKRKQPWCFLPGTQLGGDLPNPIENTLFDGL